MKILLIFLCFITIANCNKELINELNNIIKAMNNYTVEVKPYQFESIDNVKPIDNIKPIKYEINQNIAHQDEYILDEYRYSFMIGIIISIARNLIRINLRVQQNQHVR